MSYATYNAHENNAYITDEKPKLAWNKKLGYLGLVMIIIFTTHSFQFLFVDGVTDGLAARPTASSNPAYQMIFVVQLGIFIALTISHIINNGIKTPFLIAISYCMFVAGSLVWSVSPGTTLLPTIIFCYQVIAAFVVASLFTPREFLRLYFYFGLVTMLFSFYLLLIGSPNAGELRYGGGWLTDREFTGIMASKNYSGIVFASLTILAINAHHLGINRWAQIAVLIMGPIAVVLSNSATAVLILTFLSIPAILFTPRGRLWPPILYFMVLLFACLIPSLPFLTGFDISFLGRDTTFTGRSFLWEVAFERLTDYPYLGHGYYAFYDTDPYSSVWGLWERFRYWQADNFHNSFVDIIISLGFLGVAIMISTVAWAGTVIGNLSIDPASRICLGLQLCTFSIGSMMEFAIFHHSYLATFMLFYLLFTSMWQYEKE